MSLKKVIFAVDPGTGTSSPAGVAIYDPNTQRLLFTTEVWPLGAQRPTWKRIVDIAHQIQALMLAAVKEYGPLEIRSENFVMRGLGGETLQRFIGALLAVIPAFCEFNEVHNITLKRIVSGNSRADKAEMGQAVKRFFEGKDAASVDAVQKLIENSSWDAIDAIGIAICSEVMSRGK